MLGRRTISFFTYNLMYALWTLGVYNIFFWQQIGLTVSVSVFVILALVALLSLMVVQSLLFHSKTVKFLSILFLVLNSLAGYFTTSYHLILNKTMLANIFETNAFEATEWLGRAFWIYMLLFAVLPILFISCIKIEFESFGKRFKHLFVMIVGIVMLLSVFLPYKTDVKIYLKTNFNLRYQFVPTGYISGLVGLVANRFKNVEILNTTADLSFKPYWNTSKKNLIVLVLGESARDASFSLSGYKRDTAAPLREFLNDMTVFHRTEACGVVTRVSLPCMFSAYTRETYKEQAIPFSTNVLDILAKSGMDLVWLDNELGCNKVCRNIHTEYTCKSRDCTDMLLNNALREKIPDFTKDTVVVLHQRGSHGPRYDLRVPEEYRKWKPYCERSDTQRCSYEELVNAYDNTMYYTAVTIADLIRTLSKWSDKYNPVLIYMSDHGESLGENGIYGHGGDFNDATNEQKQVPFFIWMPKSTRMAFGLDKRCLDAKTGNQQSHDALFHSLLGLSGVKTKVYGEKLDIFAGCHQ